MNHPAPVQVFTFPSSRVRATPPSTVSTRAFQVRNAAAFHRDLEAMRLAQALALGLRQLADARRDRPAFLHGALLERAVGALEEATFDADAVAMAEAREWLHALSDSIGRTWALREGSAGPLDGQEQAARRAVHGAAALLAALDGGTYGEAILHAERVSHELALAQRTRESAQLLERAEALEGRLGRGGDRLIALAAGALEAAAVHALGAIDPGDLSRPASAHSPACTPQAGRHAARGLIAFAMHDVASLADEAMAAAAHLRAPECLEAGWGQVADDLLNRVEGLRAAAGRRDGAAVEHASERLEVVLAWLEALTPKRAETQPEIAPRACA